MKNRKLGKILLVALFALLFTALLAVTVSAAEPVTVDVTNEAELKAAVAADSTADVVNLVGTIQITDTVNVEKDVTITSATNATVVGKMTATTLTKGTAFKMFALADGVDVTFAGNVVYSDAGIFLGGNNTLTLMDAVQLLPGINCHAIVDTSATSTTVTVKDDALVEGKWAVYYHADATEEGVIKAFNMDGAEMVTLYGVVAYGSGYDIVADIDGALIRTDSNLFHLDYVPAGNTSVSFTDATVTTGGSVIAPQKDYTGDFASIAVSIDGGTYTATNYLISSNGVTTTNLTLTDGDFHTTELWNEKGVLNTVKTGGELTSNEFVLITADDKATFFDTLADALAAAVDGDVIEVWGTHTSGDVNVNATVTFVGNGTVNGPCHLRVADGKSVTFADRTVWNTCSVVLGGNNTVTFTDNVVFAANDTTVVEDPTLTSTTVVINSNAKITTNGWVTNYNNASTELTTKTFTMTGGSFSSNYGIVFTTGNVKVVASIKDATVSAKTSLFHLDSTNSVAGSADNRSVIVMENVTATAGRYVVGLYANCWADVTLKGANSVYNVTGTAGDDTVKLGAVAQCVTGTALLMTVEDGTFNIDAEKSVFFWNGKNAPAVITLLPAVQDTVSADDVMPVGVHVTKADGTVLCCSNLDLALERDADGDVIEINGDVTMNANQTVDKKVTINGNGTVAAGGKLLYAGAESFTLSGNVAWQTVQIRPVANTASTVTIKGNVSITGTSTKTAAVYYSDASADLTVALSEQAHLHGDWTVYSAANTADAAGSFTVTMDGGKITGNYAVVIDSTTAAVEFDLANGTVDAQCNAFHFNNGNANNVMKVKLTDMTVNTGLNGNAQFLVVTYYNSNINMTVNGGTYTSTGLSFHNNASGSKSVIDLQAGTFTGNPVFNFAAPGSLTVTVSNACVLTPALEIANGARILHTNGYTYYQTLAAAVAAAKDGDVIETIGTNTLSATFVINKDLTINGAAGTTVTASDISLFTVKNGAKLTLGGYTAWTTTNAAPITVAEGGAHIVFTDAVQVKTSGKTDSNGALVWDQQGGTNTTIEVLKNKNIEGEPVLDCTGYGFDFEGSDNATATNGIKTINMDCGRLSAAYWVVIKYTGSTLNITAKNATIATKNESLYLDNAYVETDDGIAGNGSVSTIVMENVTHTGKYLFNTQKLIHSNVTITGGSYTCTGHVFQLDYSGSVLDIDITNATLTSLNTAGGNNDWHVFNITADSADIDITITGGEVTAAKRILNSDQAATALKVTLDGGKYTASSFAFYFRTTNASSLFTAKNGASITAQWGLVSEGLTRASIASDTTFTTTGGLFAYARTAHPTDGTTVYGNLANVVAFAPANATIEIAGNPKNLGPITIDKNLTITGSGNLSAAADVSLFVVQGGAKLILSGSASYTYGAKGIVIGEGGGHIVITDTVNFTTTSGSQNGAVVYDELGNVNTTVEILSSAKGAPVLTTKGWAIDFEGDDNTAFTGIKTVTIDGATITGASHPVVFNVSGVTGIVTIKNATLSAGSEVVYINNKYFESNDNVARNGNVFNLYIENSTLTANTNIILVKANATVDVTIHSGTFTSTGGGGALLQTDKSGTYDVDLKMYGGTVTKSQFGIVFWADGTAKVLLEEKNNNAISFTTNSNMMYAGNTAKVSFNIKGGTYTAGSNFAVAASSSNVNYTLNGGTYVAKSGFFAMESNSVTTANVQNVNAKSGYDSATGTYVTEYGYGILFGANAKSTFTIGGENTVMRSPLRVFAIHDNSNVTLNIDGGVYENTTTTHTVSRFVIYQSSANGAASTLNLTAKNADFLCYAPIDGSSTFHVNDAGSTTTASFDNCLLRGAYVIRQNNGTLDLTIKGNTRIEVIGMDADRTGNSGSTGSGLFIGGENKKKTIKLISGIITCVDKTETIEIDGETVVICPNGKLNGINLRDDVVVDFVMEKDFSIIANGGFGIKNNSGRSQNSKFVFNGGTVRSSGVALGIYLRTTDNTKPSTLVINGGTFQSDSGNALQFYSDKNLAIGHIYGGTFTSNTNAAIYVHANNIKDGDVVTFEGHAELNVHDCVCISEAYDAALYASGGVSNLTDGIEAIINVYGGYFEGYLLCAARASFGGKLSIWGGTFRYKNSDAGHWGAPVRAGTGSEIGVVDIYGGNYYSTSTAASGLFTRMNANSFLTVHGGFNGIGGRVVAEYIYKNAEGKDANERSLTITHKIGTQVACNSIYMLDGAAVRLANGSNGLRFKGIVSAEAMAYINSIADEGSVRFGTLIAPADFLANAYAFTAAELDRLGLNYLDLKASNGLVINEDGSVEICAAITNIKEENINRNFAGTCYVEYTVDGNTVRVYSNYRELKNNRSIAQVARIALSDAGRYNEAQRAVLALYAPKTEAPVLDIYLVAGQSNGAGCSNFSADFKNSDENFANGYSNVLYHGVSIGGSDFASKRIYENVPVKAGYGCGTSDIGPELGMAKALSQYYNEETGRMAAIVKYAYGGTGLADTISGQNFPEGSWCPPSWLAEHGKVDEYKSGGLYRAFVAQIQSAISDFRALGYEINVVGGYWMQGENDRTKDPNTYAAMYECWLSDLRNDVYGITRDEADLKMPMVVGGISDYFNDNYHDNNLAFTQMQREQIGALENVHVLNNNTIPTVDHPNDKAHWDSHSALWIGQQVGITFMNEYLDTAYVVSDEDLVAEITLGGEVIGRYDSLVGAINDAPEGAVIELKKDLTLYSTLAIGNRNQVTLNGNEHSITFQLPASTDHTSMIMWYDTNMTVNDLHISHNNQAWGTQLRQNADVIWNGGSITANQFCFVINTNGNLTLNSGDFSVVNSEHSASAIVYVGNQDAKVTINGGTFTTTDGRAVGVHVSNQALLTVNGGEWSITGNYIFRLQGAENTLVLDKENTILNETYKIAPVFNNGYGYVEDDAVTDPFED